MSKQLSPLGAVPIGAGSFLRLRALVPSIRGITARHGRPTTLSTWSALRNVLSKKSTSNAAAILGAGGGALPWPKLLEKDAGDPAGFCVFRLAIQCQSVDDFHQNVAGLQHLDLVLHQRNVGAAGQDHGILAGRDLPVVDE